MDNKNYIKITGIPEIAFAHNFSADNYENAFSVHHHGKAFIEITYFSAGEVECTFGNDNKVIARENSVICNIEQIDLKINAPTPHTQHTVAFWIPFEVVDETEQNALCIPRSINFNNRNQITRLIDEIIAAHTMHSKGPLFCSGLFLQLLDKLDRSTRETSTEIPYSHIRYVKKAKEYIFSHLNEPIAQNDIAFYLNISPEYLCSVFKKVEGIPIIQFINHIKLEQIRILVEKTDLTLADASEQYGYSDPNYVSRLHKKYFGHNITDIKKKL